MNLQVGEGSAPDLPLLRTAGQRHCDLHAALGRRCHRECFDRRGHEPCVFLDPLGRDPLHGGRWLEGNFHGVLPPHCHHFPGSGGVRVHGLREELLL